MHKNSINRTKGKRGQNRKFSGKLKGYCYCNPNPLLIINDFALCRTQASHRIPTGSIIRRLPPSSDDVFARFVDVPSMVLARLDEALPSGRYCVGDGSFWANITAVDAKRVDVLAVHLVRQADRAKRARSGGVPAVIMASFYCVRCMGRLMIIQTPLPTKVQQISFDYTRR